MHHHNEKPHSDSRGEITDLSLDERCVIFEDHLLLKIWFVAILEFFPHLTVSAITWSQVTVSRWGNLGSVNSEWWGGVPRKLVAPHHFRPQATHVDECDRLGDGSSMVQAVQWMSAALLQNQSVAPPHTCTCCAFYSAHISFYSWSCSLFFSFQISFWELSTPKVFSSLSPKAGFGVSFFISKVLCAYFLSGTGHTCL